MQEKNIGSVVQIIGPVLDIRFPAGHLPDLLNAIEIERDDTNVFFPVWGVQTVNSNNSFHSSEKREKKKG